MRTEGQKQVRLRAGFMLLEVGWLGVTCMDNLDLAAHRYSDGISCLSSGYALHPYLQPCR